MDESQFYEILQSIAFQREIESQEMSERFQRWLQNCNRGVPVFQVLRFNNLLRSDAQIELQQETDLFQEYYEHFFIIHSNTDATEEESTLKMIELRHRIIFGILDNRSKIYQKELDYIASLDCITTRREDPVPTIITAPNASQENMVPTIINFLWPSNNENAVITTAAENEDHANISPDSSGRIFDVMAGGLFNGFKGLFG